MSTLGRKFSLDWLINKKPGSGNKAGVFDSDGNIPSEEDLRKHIGPPPSGYDSYCVLVDEAREIAGQEFERLRFSAMRGSDLHRRLFLIGGWLYSSAPPQMLDYARKSLRTGETIFKKYDFNFSGRCFSSIDDIGVLVRRVHADFRDNGLAQPFDRTKALSLVLAYRPDAPLALNGAMAYDLADAALRIMCIEQESIETGNKPKLAGTFFAAAFLLMGLLRYRRVDVSFLDQSQSTNQQFAERLRDLLTRARRTGQANLNAQLGDLFEQIPAFIEAKGTDALIFKKLDVLSE